MIDAFISKDIPEIYARTRYELVNLLKEFRAEADELRDLTAQNFTRTSFLFECTTAFDTNTASRSAMGQGASVRP